MQQPSNDLPPSLSPHSPPHARAASSTPRASGASGAPPSPPPPGTNVTAPQLMTDGLYAYLLAHTRESDVRERERETIKGWTRETKENNRQPPSPPPPFFFSKVLRRLRADTAAHAPGRDRNMVSVDTGALLGWLVRALGATRAVEVGVFTGYSSTAIAAALPPHGTLVALEKDEKPLALARAAWEAAGVSGRVDARVGDARDALAALLADPAAHASFDFAFIDADKRGYDAYYEACLQLVRLGGVIAIDNLLWYGRVADAGDASRATQAVRAMNDKLANDDRIDFVLAPVGDGVGLCRKR